MSNPSKPIDIRNTRLVEEQWEASSGSPGRAPIIGTPHSRNGGRGLPATPPIANIPLRGSGDGPPASTSMPRASPLLSRTPQTGGTNTPTGASPSGVRVNLEDVTEEEMARVLRRHLVPKRVGEGDADTNSSLGEGSRRPSTSVPSSSRNDNDVDDNKQDSVSPVPRRQDSAVFPIPYDTHGGDITHPIYKWQDEHRRKAARPRAASFAASVDGPDRTAFEHIHEPGGFRREYVLRRANEDGLDEPLVSNNFIEFLYLFGHFAGEDLEDEELEEDEIVPRDEEAQPESAAAASLRNRLRGVPDFGKPVEDSENTPLLEQRSSRRSVSRLKRSRSRRGSVASHGDATVLQAVLMLLKSFVGTGVLFLGKAFFNGGILFSTITLVSIAAISLFSFLLLLKAKNVVRGSFGDIGGELYGPWLRYAILTSIAISQLGFVCAYTIFISENLQAFVTAITNCVRVVPIQYFIMAQLVIVLPLALVRNIAKLSTTALVADVFILAGLVYIFGSEAAIIADRGVAEVQLFNPKDFPLLIGTAVFSFEGIGLVIPISDSMREPHKFPAVLTGVMIFLMFLFGGSGVLAYLTFGSDIQTAIITNLDSSSKLVQAVQLLYSLAILLSVPLQLFPAVRIMEQGIFTSSGKGDNKVKWQKNIFRFFIAIFCSLVSWAGASDLDKFVALVGSFACVPLCYVYPAMLHYKACARTRFQKIADIILMIFGLAAAAYTTVQTIILMAAPSEGTPQFGRCETNPPLL